MTVRPADASPDMDEMHHGEGILPGRRSTSAVRSTGTLLLTGSLAGATLVLVAAVALNVGQLRPPSQGSRSQLMASVSETPGPAPVAPAAVPLAPLPPTLQPSPAFGGRDPFSPLVLPSTAVPVSSRTDATPVVIPSSAEPPTSATPEPPGTSAPPVSPPTLAAPPSQGSVAPAEGFWTVILESLAKDKFVEADARREAEATSGRGITAAVLDSSSYPSLRPGYWVLYSMQFPSRPDASEAAVRLWPAGFPDAYPRCVGTAAQCPPTG